MAPILFSVLIDDIIKLVSNADIGVILFYADDILIVARSRMLLQELFSLIETMLSALNFVLNVNKCVCIRIGHRFDRICVSIKSHSGATLSWVNEIKYLGVYIVSGRQFRIAMDAAKRKFNRSVNSILSKTLGSLGEDVILHLIKLKCLPILLYGCEVCVLPKAAVNSLDFVLVRFGMKIFRTSSRNTVLEIFENMGLKLPSQIIPWRAAKFISRLDAIDNVFVRLCCKI